MMAEIVKVGMDLSIVPDTASEGLEGDDTETEGRENERKRLNGRGLRSVVRVGGENEEE